MQVLFLLPYLQCILIHYRGLGGCLASSTVLAHLELKKIIIAPNNIKFISKVHSQQLLNVFLTYMQGLSQNNCLRELLFVDCKIGDDGFAGEL